MEGLKKTVKYLYGLPSFGFQVFVNAEMTFLAAFLTDYVQLPLALASSLLLITSIFDIIWVPTAGIILEKSDMKWGKYRSWLLVGPPIAAIFYVFEFSKLSANNAINAIIIFIGFVVSHLVWNTYYAAHIAMNNSMTTVREERVVMSANRGIFNSVGALAFSFFGVKSILSLGEAIGNKTLGVTLVVMVLSVLMMACFWIYFVLTKPYAQSGVQKKDGITEKPPISEMIKQIIVNPPLIGLMLVELGRYLGRFIIFGMAFYYFKYVINDLPGLALFMTGLTIAQIVASAIAAPIAKKFGEKMTYFVSMLLLVGGLLLVWALPLSAANFKMVMFVAYLGYGLPDSLNVAMYSATVDYGEWKTGKNIRGFVMSLISFPIKTAVFIRSVIIAAVLAAAGYVADMAPTPVLINGIKNGFALYPAIIMIIGLALMFAMYSLTPKRLSEIHADLKKR